MQTKVPINSIIIGDRQRDLDLPHVANLKDLIADLGLIQYPVIGRDMVLIAGAHRLQACKELGWTEIPVIFSDLVDEVQKQKAQFIEDTARKDRTWQERCKAIALLHRLLMREKISNGEWWTVKETAKFTNGGLSNTKYILDIYDYTLTNPDSAVAKAVNISAAISELVKVRALEAQREQERRRQIALQVAIPKPVESFSDAMLLANQGISAVTPNGDLVIPPPSNSQSPTLTAMLPLETEEMVITLCGIDMPFHAGDIKFNSAICNAPILDIAFLNELYASLKDTGCAIIWTSSPSGFDNWKDEAKNAGFYVQSWPLVWHKMAGTDSRTPFEDDYVIGIVLHKSLPKHTGMRFPSVVIAPDSGDGSLPVEVLSHSLEAISLENELVLLTNNAPAFEIAMLGRIPFFFEADKVQYNEKMGQLKAYYQSRHGKVRFV